MLPFLYLLRHAHANDAADDASRTLSHRGHGEIARLAHLLRGASGFHPAHVWHSPLVRARETALLLAHELKLRPTFAEHRELEPEAEPGAVARKLTGHGGSLMLVGHEPHMSGLASLLVAGSPEPVVFTFQKATLLALEPAGKRWSVRWQISPDLLG